MKNPDLPKLLRAVAEGSDAIKSGQAVIFMAAANELEQLRTAAAKAHSALIKSSLAPSERVFDATSILMRVIR